MFAAAAAITALLGLDATVVLLTPAVFAAAARLRTSPRPHAYACTHLANSASLLLPISNLTNLLAFRATGTSFAGFAALMAGPWLVALAVEWTVLSEGPLGDALTSLVPGGAGLPALLATAALAAALANVLNNLPALLLLLPAVAAGGRGPVLAALIGVNAGPNLTYVGSLATLLWRRVVRHHGEEPPAAEFLRLGAVTVPIVLVGATVALWLALRIA